jgi:enamine deaminase RidA (YjgF/YER057c/UK114 family)
MLERYYVTPEDSYKTAGDNRVAYTPAVVVRTGDCAHVYLSGRTARLPNGQLYGKGDMRAQIRLVCENIKTALDSVGATFADVVRTTTYTTDIDDYYRCSDERFKFFKDPLPTSTLLGVSRLGMPDMLVEIELEAIMEAERLRLPKK